MTVGYSYTEPSGKLSKAAGIISSCGALPSMHVLVRVVFASKQAVHKNDEMDITALPAC